MIKSIYHFIIQQSIDKIMIYIYNLSIFICKFKLNILYFTQETNTFILSLNYNKFTDLLYFSFQNLTK